jgi:methyl-accepting chemotaxis protein
VQEVAAASREQSSGVDQVNKAMARVDQVTQRNASAAEELGSTAEEMAAQAEGLEQLVAFFHVGAEASQRPVRAAATRTSFVAPAVAEHASRKGPHQRLRRRCGEAGFGRSDQGRSQ